MKDKIVESVINKFKQRSEAGIKKYGEFQRYGMTKRTAIVIFDNDGLSFCDEDSINYANGL